ncbi:MAG TPA: RNA methyltransferase, partial [Candidatus Cloacimonadota bacterium]|nr:RNA methyltransferase [Candidatus Cloacimonadota bacterium]
MPKIQILSKAKITVLFKLHQKKYRQQRQVLVLEGQRLLQQLADYGVYPLEYYFTEGSHFTVPKGIPVYQIRESELSKICDSEHPAGIAALFPLPRERRSDFRSALYLDGITDPGNLGTIFRM